MMIHITYKYNTYISVKNGKMKYLSFHISFLSNLYVGGYINRERGKVRGKCRWGRFKSCWDKRGDKI